MKKGRNMKYETLGPCNIENIEQNQYINFDSLHFLKHPCCFSLDSKLLPLSWWPLLKALGGTTEDC